jgi:SAM-dependent methyltransferase
MTRRPWNRNIHYHDVVLDAIPAGCRRVLDAGCGQGFLTRELARRFDDVVAVDVDRGVLERARSQNDPGARITFVEGDVMTQPFAAGSFDAIAAVAVLHHLPLAPALARFRDLLRPGGVLAIVGLHPLRTPLDYALAGVAIPTALLLQAVHGRTDVGAPLAEPQETLGEIRTACAAQLPGAEFQRRLLFRYSIVWRKPVAE